MRAIVVLLLILGVSSLWSQESFQVVITKPVQDELFGWAQSPPSVTIQASLQRDSETVTPEKEETFKRLFLTAQIFVNDRLVDTVPLWDDGTHGDEKAKDGIFTSQYRPNLAGEFKVRVRAQADLVQEGKTAVKEFWSPFVSFQVIAIPYPHIVFPEPGMKIGTKTRIRARLLLQGKPFEERDESLRARVVAKLSGQALVQTTLKRSGSLLIGSLNLPKIGTYQVVVSVSVVRQGKKLSAESEPVEIQASRPPLLLLIVTALLFVIYLLLPPKEPPLRYRHRVRVGQTEVELNPGEERNVNELKVKGAFDSNTLTVRTPQGEEKIFREQQTERLSWREGEERKEVIVQYIKAEPLRDKPPLLSRLLPTTFYRFISFLLVLLALGWWLYLWQQIRQ